MQPGQLGATVADGLPRDRQPWQHADVCLRDVLVAGQRELRGAIAKAVRMAIDAGHLSPNTDPWQLTFEMFGVVLATHHDRRLLGDARAAERARFAFRRLIAANATATSHGA